MIFQSVINTPEKWEKDKFHSDFLPDKSNFSQNGLEYSSAEENGVSDFCVMCASDDSKRVALDHSYCDGADVSGTMVPETGTEELDDSLQNLFDTCAVDEVFLAGATPSFLHFLDDVVSNSRIPQDAMFAYLDPPLPPVPCKSSLPLGGQGPPPCLFTSAGSTATQLTTSPKNLGVSGTSSLLPGLTSPQPSQFSLPVLSSWVSSEVSSKFSSSVPSGVSSSFVASPWLSSSLSTSSLLTSSLSSSSPVFSFSSSSVSSYSSDLLKNGGAVSSLSLFSDLSPLCSSSSSLQSPVPESSFSSTDSSPDPSSPVLWSNGDCGQRGKDGSCLEGSYCSGECDSLEAFLRSFGFDDTTPVSVCHHIHHGVCVTCAPVSRLSSDCNTLGFSSLSSDCNTLGASSLSSDCTPTAALTTASESIPTNTSSCQDCGSVQSSVSSPSTAHEFSSAESTPASWLSRKRNCRGEYVAKDDKTPVQDKDKLLNDSKQDLATEAGVDENAKSNSDLPTKTPAFSVWDEIMVDKLPDSDLKAHALSASHVTLNSEKKGVVVKEGKKKDLWKKSMSVLRCLSSFSAGFSSAPEKLRDGGRSPLSPINLYGRCA